MKGKLDQDRAGEGCWATLTQVAAAKEEEKIEEEREQRAAEL